MINKTFRSSIVALVLLRVTAAAADPCSAVAPKAGLGDLGSLISQEMQKAKLPGLSIAIVQNGKMLCAEGFGLRDVQHKVPVTPNTLFAIGSTTKSFTVLTMGILNDEGKLDWDKPVRQYLPELQMYDPVASERMTPRDLITHRVGFAGHDLVWYSSDFSREDLVHRLRYLESDRDFRSGYRYNNLLVATAGYLAGKVAGTSWEEFVRQRILMPLKMQNTNFSVRDSRQSSDFSLPYQKDDKTGVVKQIEFHVIDAIGPAGSINSNVVDLSNYVIMQLGKGKFSGQEIVSEANLNLMHSPQTAIPSPPQFRELGQTSYGMGWVITAYRGHRYIWHNGGIDGFYALIAMLPDDDIGVIVLTNTLGRHQVPEIVAYNVFDHVTRQTPIDWSSRFQELAEKHRQADDQAKSKASDVPQPDRHPARDLQDYVGRYQNDGYGTIQIRVGEKGLLLSLNNLPAPLVHLYYDVFKVPAEADSPLAGKKFQFQSNMDGSVSSIAAPLQPGLHDILFSRMPDKVGR